MIKKKKPTNKITINGKIPKDSNIRINNYSGRKKDEKKYYIRKYCEECLKQFKVLTSTIGTYKEKKYCSNKCRYKNNWLKAPTNNQINPSELVWIKCSLLTCLKPFAIKNSLIKEKNYCSYICKRKSSNKDYILFEEEYKKYKNKLLL